MYCIYVLYSPFLGPICVKRSHIPFCFLRLFLVQPNTKNKGPLLFALVNLPFRSLVHMFGMCTQTPNSASTSAVHMQVCSIHYNLISSHRKYQFNNFSSDWQSIYMKKKRKCNLYVQPLDPLKQVLGRRKQYNISSFLNSAVNHRKHFPYSRFVDNVVIRNE